MKIQIAAVLSTDCYLLSPAKGINSRWAFPKQHTLFSLRNETDLLLSKDTSLLSLLSEKQHNTDITYLAEGTPDTLDLIKGLLLYGLADELYLYILPEHTGKGILLSTLIRLEEWYLVREHPRHIISRIYRKKG